jgi:nitrous oxidase accessory protein NosD
VKRKKMKTKNNLAIPTIIAVTVAVFILVAFSATASADATLDHYVDPAGSDTPPYATLATAAHSIQDAIDAANSGDTVHVADATYNENLIIDNAITLQAGSTPIIDGGGSGACIIISSSNVIIDGFDITNGYYGIQTYGGPSTYDNIEIKNNDIYHNKKNGILITYDTITDLEIKNNHITDTYQTSGNGIGIANNAQVTGMLVQDTTIDDSEGHGIYINGGTISDLTLDKVVIEDNGWEGIHVINVAVTNLNIEESKIKNNNGMGVVFKGSSTLNGVTIDDTEFTGNSQSGLAFAQGTFSDLDIHGCTFQGNGWEHLDLGIGWIGASSFTNVEIAYNDFLGGGVWCGIYIDSTASFDDDDINIHCNDIVGNDGGVYNSNPSNTVNAIQNWWGDTSGPSGQGTGFGDAVSDYVDFEPWSFTPDPCEPKTIGFWKTHGDSVDAVLVEDETIYLGSYLVSTPEDAQAVFDNAKNKNANTMLAAQLLAAKLNVAHLEHLEIVYCECIDGVIEDADEFLTNHGYNGHNVPGTVPKEDKEQANGYKDDLDEYNQGVVCPCT